jgi:hypothetical protein
VDSLNIKKLSKRKTITFTQVPLLTLQPLNSKVETQRQSGGKATFLIDYFAFPLPVSPLEIQIFGPQNQSITNESDRDKYDIETSEESLIFAVKSPDIDDHGEYRVVVTTLDSEASTILTLKVACECFILLLKSLINNFAHW